MILTDTGFFQINDIVLNVPPDNIRINRSATIRSYKPLRTRGSAKVRSPTSVIEIMFEVKFVGTEEINQKLLPLVAQLKLTPFCYVDNQFLRDNILGTDNQENLALVLTNLSVSTVPNLPDTWNGVFSFVLFNYKPYVKEFKFKNDIFGSSWKNKRTTPGTFGIEYTAFSDFYALELSKLNPVFLLISARTLADWLDPGIV